MDLISLIAIIAVIIGIYVFPSSFITKLEQRIHNKIAKNAPADVIDIDKMKRNLL